MIPLVLMMFEDDADIAFAEKLFLSYQRLIRSEVAKILPDDWAVDDVLQNVLFKLFKRLDRLKTLEHEELINYIIKASQNTTYTYIQKEKRQRGFALIEDLDRALEPDVALDYRLLSIEDSEIISAAWKALNPKSQRILSMKHILHKTNKEIAEDLKITPDSVRTLLMRARNELKVILAAENKDFFQ